MRNRENAEVVRGCKVELRPQGRKIDEIVRVESWLNTYVLTYLTTLQKIVRVYKNKGYIGVIGSGVMCVRAKGSPSRRVLYDGHPQTTDAARARVLVATAARLCPSGVVAATHMAPPRLHRPQRRDLGPMRGCGGE